MTLTIAAVAEHKHIRPEKIEVQIDYQIHPGTPLGTSFKIEIDLGTGLTHRQRTILFNVARTCEVYKMLTGEITCDYDLK